MIESERLILRAWQADDFEPFAAMCRDPRIMATIGPMLDDAGVAAWIARQEGFQREFGHCFWVLERKEDGAFIGFCGVKPGAENTPVEGRPEIGWRLAHAHWGKGYAREAAEAALNWSWARGLPAVFAITVRENHRSWGLMERLGMVRLADGDFDHPLAPPELLAHVTYKITAPEK